MPLLSKRSPEADIRSRYHALLEQFSGITDDRRDRAYWHKHQARRSTSSVHFDMALYGNFESLGVNTWTTSILIVASMELAQRVERKEPYVK